MAPVIHDSGIAPEVRWQEGLLLMPQHLQLQARQLGQYALGLVQLLQQDLWGVLELAVNDKALDSGVVELDRFAALYPDGTQVRLGDNATLASRHLLDEIRGETDIYVALQRPAANRGRPTEPDLAGDDDNGRYIRDHVRVSDCFGECEDADVPVVRYRLKLVLAGEKEALQDHDLVQVGRLELRGDTLRLVEGYIPPVVSIGVSPALLAYVNNLLSWLEHKRRRLARDKSALREPGQACLYALLCRCLGQWSLWTTEKTVSPRHVYQCVLAAACEAAFLAAGGDTSPLYQLREATESYSHRHITTSLARAAQRLRQTINDMQGMVVQELAFVREGHFHYLSLDRDTGRQLIRASRLRLRLVTEPGKRLQAGLVSGQCKLACPGTLTHLVARSLPGIPLLPVSSGEGREVLLDIRREGEYWEEIEAAGALALHLEKAPDSLQVYLQAEQVVEAS